MSMLRGIHINYIAVCSIKLNAPGAFPFRGHVQVSLQDWMVFKASDVICKSLIGRRRHETGRLCAVEREEGAVPFLGASMNQPRFGWMIYILPSITCWSLPFGNTRIQFKMCPVIPLWSSLLCKWSCETMSNALLKSKTKTSTWTFFYLLSSRGQIRSTTIMFHMSSWLGIHAVNL